MSASIVNSASAHKPQAQRERFELLDGLRGVAALMVIVHHVGLIRGGEHLSHGYLGVDLFFVLSGFVIGHAYEAKWSGGLSLIDFAKQRFIRLYPTIALGALIGFFAYFSDREPGGLLVVLIAHLLFIPLFSGRLLFELNSVQWSLFFEIVANVVHAVLFRWITLRVIIGTVFVSVVAMAWVLFHYRGAGVGWGRENFLAGFPRLIFSYFSGLLLFRLFRSTTSLRFSVPWWLVCAAPVFVVEAAGLLGVRGDFLAILVWPFVVWFALFSKAPRWVLRVAEVAGIISFPIYAIQMPLFHLAEPYLRGGTLFRSAIFVSGMAVAALLIARFFDSPIRDYLKRKLV